VTRERRKLIDEIFLGAVELPPSERPAFLAISCPDEEIAREVNSLLQFDGGESSFERVVRQAAASLISGDPMIGARLGPYRITEEIGKGGMGSVFLAVRDDRAFEKKVAIKVVKRGMDSDAVLARFRHERRILANLNHPYISHLIDAGTTPDGRPYFVMEYVAGEPVAAYAVRRNLDIPAILELFRKICDAVAYAHRNLVIHRDLKASNILVSEDGSPKLLDFGIAKLLDPQSRTEDTAPLNRMLTLDCASPEQVLGEAVTTSSDIYSLGMLLFQLLAGRPPWNLGNISSAAAARLICWVTPPKPSVLFRSSGGNGSGHAAHGRALAGDLDNIVLMALRKDPARRYRSVDEFSEDIRRFQAGLPVIAREDSFAYRALKFVGRNRIAVLLATLAIAGLMAGIIDANIERRRAEVRLTEMLGMTNQTLLGLQTQIEHQPGATESRLRIMQSTLAYLGRLAKESGNNQEVRAALGTAYLRTGDVQGYPHAPNLGDLPGALASYEQAEKLFDQKDHIHLAGLLVHRGEILFALGRVPESLAVLRQGMEHADKSGAAAERLNAAGALSRELGLLGRREEALRYAEQAAAAAEEAAEKATENRPLVPRAHSWLGGTFEALAHSDASPEQRRADWRAAAESYSRALESWRKMNGRAGFPREIDECIRKEAECNRRANLKE
jgi:serine/threonine protein kinase